MKRIIAFLVFVVLSIFTVPGFVSADPPGWTNDTRLTFNPAYSMFPSLSTDQNGNVHVAWDDDRNGNRRVYYKKLSNNGVNLTPEIMLTFDPIYSASPSISTDQYTGLLHYLPNRS